jgi:hypothetical protein
VVHLTKRSEAKEAHQQARQAYLDSLEKLKRDPQNPDLVPVRELEVGPV